LFVLSQPGGVDFDLDPKHQLFTPAAGFDLCEGELGTRRDKTHGGGQQLVGQGIEQNTRRAANGPLAAGRKTVIDTSVMFSSVSSLLPAASTSPGSVRRWSTRALMGYLSAVSFTVALWLSPRAMAAGVAASDSATCVRAADRPAAGSLLGVAVPVKLVTADKAFLHQFLRALQRDACQ